MMRRHGNVGLAVLVVGVVALSSCSSGSSGGSSSHSTVDVFAASSLTDAFTRIGKDFEDHQHNRTATFSFAGSQALAAQIGEGAPADVLATADTTTMAEVQNELLADPQTLAHNRLVIVTDKGNPRDVTTLQDLADPSLVVVLADPSVPAGNYAAQALAAAHVDVKPKSLEPEVRSVLTKVEIGEADAGIVYATDAKSAAGKVSSTAISDAPLATYQIAPLTAAGRAFVAYVLSPAGQADMARYGFLPP